jgi:uncharacterized protein DUF1302
LVAPSAFADFTLRHELSIGGMVRMEKRDPGLVGGGNGGTGTSVNYDDGNLNYGRGLTSWAIQGRSTLESASATSELKIETVYFYDFVAAETEFRSLSREARARSARST